VALTRAEHRVVVYAGPTSGKPPPCEELEDQDYAQSMLAVLFHGATPDDRKDLSDRPVPELLQEIRELAPGHVSVEEVEPVGGAADARVAGERKPEAAPAPWTRDGLDTLWRRESYTGIVGKRKGMSGAVVRDGEEDVADRDDDSEEPEAEQGEAFSSLGEMLAEPPILGSAVEQEDAPEPMPIPEPEDDVPSAVPDIDFRAFYSGAEAGTWVHAVFEHTSFPTCAPKTGGDFASLVRARGERAGFPKDTKDHLLLEAFPRMLDTPLGAVVGGRTLRSVTDADRLDELRFDVSVGDAERHRVKGRALFEKLGAARADDPMPEGYLEHVRSLNARPLQGFLTGAIDLVFRARIGERVQWFVADYKTNVLGPRRDGRLARSAPGHYAQAWMRAEIARKHYYVQYVLYLVALDRYLRLRMGADYDYDRDVGGALYLFVRGMVGSATTVVDGRVHGVFHDKPPKAVIHGVSQLLLGDLR
jgi:exodeoxyribonuclease V beta subunit